ncbi:MAG: cbb3-type cytochrome c oxidase subunit II [Verrucomicrobia subdivision 3 bacterium]|nr:cbb3-type cytochrome c oxidase subunit II [Verrucomicrobiota bacterium]MCC6822970.1 cbb3-type cytochrome c oxidase subunit II [Limisphaerales bacterium]
MKSSALVFLAAFIALSASWGGFVLAPQLQLGRAAQVKTIPAQDNYPVARPGLAAQGAEVYRSLGCVYCHSQSVGQDGVKCEIVLTDAGTNAIATLAALGKFNAELGKPTTLALLPKAILQVADMNAADPILKAISSAGAKAQVLVSALGPDMARGWGRRRTVAQDYLYDLPVQPGSRRAGPDLANVGWRWPDANWQLRHLYAPAAEVQGSTMPAYRFLFELRPLGKPAAASALQLSGAFAPPAGFEIVPTDAARALAAYLVSLRADAPLFESPFTAPAAPAAATNSPVK